VPRRLSLATQILLLQLAIVAVTASVGAAVTLRHSYRQLDAQYGKRVLAIAESVAAMPSIQDAFTDPDPPHTIQPIAEGIRKAAGAEFVVVANKQQIRYSHPDLTKIGGRLSTDASDALAGRTWVGTQTGTLGRSIRAKVPVYDRNGEVIGVVSVGILTDKVSQDLLDTLPQLLLYLALGLVLGVAGSYLLARRVRRQTFGLEPHEIAGLLENREATLSARAWSRWTCPGRSPWPTTRRGACWTCRTTRSAPGWTTWSCLAASATC
jgi:two-component system, CitB family, sensor kinase